MTLGQLFFKDAPLKINESHIYIGEDVSRPDGVKIEKETAIPAGDYFLDITFSNRFQKPLPLIYNESDLSIKSGDKKWTGVRQHNGNTEADTDACQLMGLGRNSTGVYQSNDALALYIPWLEKVIKEAGGKIPYRIINKQK